MVLTLLNEPPELVEQFEFVVGFVAVSESVFTNPVTVALLNVCVVVVLVGATPGDVDLVLVGPGRSRPSS